MHDLRTTIQPHGLSQQVWSVGIRPKARERKLPTLKSTPRQRVADVCICMYMMYKHVYACRCMYMYVYACIQVLPKSMYVYACICMYTYVYDVFACIMYVYACISLNGTLGHGNRCHDP